MRSILALRWLTSLVTATALVTSAGPIRADGGAPLEQVVDGYHVELVFAETLKLGVVPVHVNLLDAAGQPVPGARVQVVQTLISAFETGGHGAGAGDSPSTTDAHAEADDGHATTDDAHGPEGGDAHAAADDGHADGASHGASEDDHAQAETAGAHGEADPHAQSVAHSHDDSSLFQLAWDAGRAAHTGAVIFFEAGQWGVHVEFTVDGQKRTAEFIADVPPADPGPAVLAGFAGINAVILITAVVLRRKSAASAGAGAV
jgi:hypothetical protein